MSVDTATVARIATLARLRVSEDDAKRLVGELNGILEWVEQLDSLDTEGVEPMTSGLGQALRQRPDQVQDGGDRDRVLSNAPRETQGFYTVPKVVE